MLGTGLVNGENRQIAPKMNGLGSKNFGIRTLFLYGDRIFIRSNGKQTILDRLKGALPKPISDPNSKGRPGVQIDVPYRSTKSGKFEPFGTEQEKSALENFLTDLAHTLIKLAQPNTKKSLTMLEVLSNRHNYQIKWKQSVKVVPCRQRGITAIRRIIRSSASSPSPAQKLEEIEWRKVFIIPPEYRDRAIPGYFKFPGSRISIALSLPIHRGKVNIKQKGRFFYPLGIRQSYTGTAISVNAPFEMDADRSQIIDPTTSPWNTWLLKTAADLTRDLLVSDWFERFDYSAYLALRIITQPTVPYYSGLVKERLEKEHCWPTRARKGKNRQVFKSIKEIVIPAHPALDGFFLSNERYLDNKIASNLELQKMAKEYGAKFFGVNSLVWLRCAGVDTSTLATKLAVKEAGYCYDNFPDALKGLGLQKKFGDALDALSKRLSKDNRNDLRESPTTLTSAGDLKSPSTPLWVIDSTIFPVCPVPESDRLHPSLIKSNTIRKLCKEFDPEQWAQEVAQKIQNGTTSEEECMALYKYILSTHGHLKRKTLTILRKSPVLLDHNREWVHPSSIIRKGARGANKLKPALHLPHPAYAKDIHLARAFRFKQKVGGEDIIKYANIVTSQPDLAAGFEEILKRYSHLLTKKVIISLKEIAFLQSSLGTLKEPQQLYLRTSLNKICLDENAPFVLGKHISLYKRLGCMKLPKAADIIAFLLTLSERGERPDNAQKLYPALIDALKREGKSTSLYENQSILWNGNGYSCPKDTLLGLSHQKIFLDAVPKILKVSKSLEKALFELGAYRKPKPHHWLQLFSWFNEKYKETGGPITNIEHRALIEAYRRLQELPEDLPEDAKCFLDRDKRLHSMNDIRSGDYLIDDDPRMVKVMSEQNIPINFADTDDHRIISF